MRALIAAALLLISGVGLGQAADGETPLRTLVTANDTKGWEAVGRLDIGRDSFCTGALIAPDLVLTAAHCMFDVETRARIPEGEIRFLAGWRNGRATAYRGVRRAIVHPDYEYLGPESGEHVAEDLALLALDQPIRNTTVTPFRTSKRPRKGDEVGVVSYAHDRATRPSLQEVCHVLGRPGGTLVMSCDVDFGSSGAPVFTIRDGEPMIVSVISAKATVAGRRVSLGTGLESKLLDMQRLMDEGPVATVAEAGPKVRKLGGAERGGAKFLRP